MPFANHVILTYQWKKPRIINVSIQKLLWQGEIDASAMCQLWYKFILFVHYHCGHPLIWNSMKNQICSSGIGNDNIGQGVDAIS
jgi:hypothetical protein